MKGFISASILVLWSAAAVMWAQQPSGAPAAPAAGGMILIRACDVVQGRGQDARKWAAEIVALANAQPQRPFTNVRVYSEILGQAGRLHFLIELADFDQLQRFLGSPPASPKMQEMMKQTSTLLRDCRDTLVREMRAAQ